MKYKSNLRIGIIGAGPAGLSSAESLRELGYKDITILEKSNRPGGMVFSSKYITPDKRELVFEIGALQPTSSSILYRLLKRYGIHVGKSNLTKDYNPNKANMLQVYSLEQRKTIVDFKKYKFFGVPLSFNLFKDIFKLLGCLFKYRALRKPGFHLPPEQLKELSVSYDQWVDQQQFKVINDPMKLLAVTATMGNPEWQSEYIALDMIKFILQMIKLPISRVRFINGQLKMVREGYQELWIRIAKQHHVIYNAAISRVIRKSNEVEVDLGDQKLTFDKIIITCSPPQIKTFLDVTDEEAELFSKTRYNPGWKFSFLAKNLPHDGWYMFYENSIKGQGLMPGYWVDGEVGEGIWLYSSAISLSNDNLTDSHKKEIEKMLHEHFKTEVIEWVYACFWPEYIPHYSSIDIQNGIYNKLDNLQGKNNTYYAGGAISASTNAIIVDYVYAMTKKFF